MKEFTQSRARSFRHAFDGWWYVIRTQKNAWIHAAISISVVIAGLWLDLSAQNWAIIVIAIALVWMAEFLNTALEALVDLASPNRHNLAKICKDVGAAAVLIAAGSAIIIGIFILGPPLLEKFSLT